MLMLDKSSQTNYESRHWQLNFKTLSLPPQNVIQNGSSLGCYFEVL